MNRLPSPSRALLVLVLALLPLTGGVACKAKSTKVPVGMDVVIEPTQFKLTTDRTLTAVRAVRNSGNAIPVFTYSWTRDGVDAMNNTKTVPSSDTTKGEVWEVTVVATFPNGTVVTGKDSATIVNSPPTITNAPLLVQPLPLCDNDTASYSPNTFDADGDPVTVRQLWLVNGTAGENTTTLGPAFFTIGDVVRVFAVPNDGEEDGPFKASPGSGPNAAVVQNPSGNSNCSNPTPALSVPILTPPPVVVFSGGGPGTGATSSGSATLSAGSGGATSGRSLTATATAAPTDAADATTTPAEELGATAQSVSVGPYNVCSIDAAGALACSGDDSAGITAPPAGVHLQVDVASDYACAIGADDLAIRCWGAPADAGLLSPPAGEFVQLGLADASACGLRFDGGVACWGDAAAAAPEGPFLSLDVSGSFACAIDADGLVSCWGD